MSLHILFEILLPLVPIANSSFLENEPERYSVDSKVIPGEDFPYDRIVGGRNYKWRSRAFDELFYDYNGITIWGLTARVIYSFANIIFF